MPEPIPAKVFAAVPARHHDDMVLQVFAFQHPQDYHARAAFAVIVFQWRIGQQNGPCIMRGLREFLVSAQRLNEIAGLSRRPGRPARNRIFRPAITDNILDNFQNRRTIKSRGMESMT